MKADNHNPLVGYPHGNLFVGKKTIQVRSKSSGSVITTIKRVLDAENIGNFCPLFCTYKKKKVLVKSEEGDLSDIFHRKDSYAESLYIEVV